MFAARALPWVDRAFAHAEDFASPWRHADGSGPLYIVDECHFAMPRGGTLQAVEEWFSMHRHFNADVLLITQSSGKISAAIKDLVQVVYKVRKAVAFGRSGSYIRKVLDGVNGAEISVSERKYLAQYFKLYRSHTQGVAAAEIEASDVSPFIVKFKRYTWAVYGVFFVCLLLLGNRIYQKRSQSVVDNSPLAHTVKQTSPAKALFDEKLANGSLQSASAPFPVAVASAPVVEVKKVPLSVDVDGYEIPEPYQGKGILLTGSGSMNGRTIYVFAITQNAIVTSRVTDADMVKAGYKWLPLHSCAGTLIWRDKGYPITCELPSQGIGSKVIS
jgi:zona occludens toxin